MTRIILLPALVTLLTTLIVVSAIFRWSGPALLDLPNARSLHRTPTPRGGGLGICVGLVIGLAIWWIVAPAAGETPLWPALLVVGFVTFVSFLDDLHPLAFSVRLIAHGAAAAMLLWLVGPFEVLRIPLLGFFAVAWWGLLLSLLWCVGLTNAYNFMDGIDGIAAMQGLVGGLAWGAIGLTVSQPIVAVLGFLVAAACGAFLRFNWHPARIFMGDVGSGTLGMLFAAIPLLANAASPGEGWAAPVGVLVVWPFVFDAGATFLCRLFRGEHVFSAHRSHYYQRLVLAGWSHPRVAGLYGMLALATGGGALVIALGDTLAGLFAWGSALGTAIILPFLVWRAERPAKL